MTLLPHGARTWGWRLDVQLSGETGPWQVREWFDDRKLAEVALAFCRDQAPDLRWRCHNPQTGESLP